MLHETAVPARVPDGTAAGAAIFGCGLLSLLVVAHHPVVHAHGAAQVMHGIAEASTLDRAVHGVLIAFMFALAFGFSIFALRRGLQHQTTVAGLVAYLAGAGAVTLAALIDGFFVPALAAAHANGGAATLVATVAVLSAAGVLIQVVTTFGFFALSAGILAWSLHLLRTSSAVRYAGVLGLGAAVVPPAVVAAAGLHIAPATIVSALVPEALWYAVVGALMVRRVL